MTSVLHTNRCAVLVLVGVTLWCSTAGAHDTGACLSPQPELGQAKRAAACARMVAANQKKCQGGDADACNYLGNSYRSGRAGVPVDAARAKRAYQRAFDLFDATCRAKRQAHACEKRTRLMRRLKGETRKRRGKRWASPAAKPRASRAAKPATAHSGRNCREEILWCAGTMKNCGPLNRCPESPHYDAMAQAFVVVNKAWDSRTSTGLEALRTRLRTMPGAVKKSAEWIVVYAALSFTLKPEERELAAGWWMYGSALIRASKLSKSRYRHALHTAGEQIKAHGNILHRRNNPLPDPGRRWALEYTAPESAKPRGWNENQERARDAKRCASASNGSAARLMGCAGH